MTGEIYQWYALYTRSRFEHKVYTGLCGKSLTAFLPRVKVMSRRRDRRKMILTPMLPGYVFVRSNLHHEEHLEILKTPGVVRMVGIKGRPVPVAEAEISSLMILDGTDRTVRNRAYMKKGDRVVIMEGPLKGLTGFYVRHKGKSGKVVISIDLLRRSLEVDIEDWALEKVQ